MKWDVSNKCKFLRTHEASHPLPLYVAVFILVDRPSTPVITNLMDDPKTS